jgi:SNF2 family DNA or RNA helicase
MSEINRVFILRRTKKQVGIDLMDAVENKKIVEWKSAAERKLSEEIHSLIAFTNVKWVENSIRYSHYDNRNALLSLLLKARQSCIYPKMVARKGGQCESELKNITTSKLDSVVDAILERKDNGNGKIVFCHFKDEINEIASRLRADDLGSGGLNVGILDGSMSKSARKKILSDNKDVLIMQIQTGCEGLNLQDNYSEVYFVSPHWNPYVEDQAIARCHRIGQKKPVFVWRFEMNNFGVNALEDGKVVRTQNLEEYVNDVQNGKRTIVSNML